MPVLRTDRRDGVHSEEFSLSLAFGNCFSLSLNACFVLFWNCLLVLVPWVTALTDNTENSII